MGQDSIHTVLVRGFSAFYCSTQVPTEAIPKLNEKKRTENRYGKSEGTPSEEGLILDVEASLRALRESPKSGVDASKLVLFGRSLGGAVALAAADRYSDLVSEAMRVFGG